MRVNRLNCGTGLSAWTAAKVLAIVQAAAPFMATALALVTMGVGISQAAAGNPEAEMHVLDWADLVPAGWEAPIIAPAYDEDPANMVDETSRVPALDGQTVRLPGYIKPVVFKDRTVSEFLLVPFLPHHVKHHAHLESNQMVYVRLARSIEVDNPFEPLWVTGTLRLEAVATDEGPAGYSLDRAETHPYALQD